MITPLIVPLALLAAPTDIPLSNDVAVQVQQANVSQTSGAGENQPATADASTPPVPAAAQPSVVPSTADELDDVGTDDVKVDKDPLEGFNRAMFGIHQAIDKAVFRPAAMGYKHVVPKPIRSGARNVLSNLTEPFVFVNFLLQGKPGKAAETFARFVVNSTLGVAGLFDVAKNKDFKLPHRQNSFGTTLAIYGVKSGPYLFIPFMGPTTLRDALSKPADEALLPVAVGRPFSTMEFQLATGVVGGLDMRAEADPELRALFGDSIDPYATMRSVYLQNRAAEIEETRGRHKLKKGEAQPEFDEPLLDPAGPAAPSEDPELQDPMKDPAGSSAQSDAPELQSPLADPAGTSVPSGPPELQDALADPVSH